MADRPANKADALVTAIAIVVLCATLYFLWSVVDKTGPVALAIGAGTVGWLMLRRTASEFWMSVGRLVGVITLGFIPQAVLLYCINSRWIGEEFLEQYEDLVWNLHKFIEAWLGPATILVLAVVVLFLVSSGWPSFLAAYLGRTRKILTVINALLAGATAFVVAGQIPFDRWKPNLIVRLEAALQHSANQDVERLLWTKLQSDPVLQKSVSEFTQSVSSKFNRNPPGLFTHRQIEEWNFAVDDSELEVAKAFGRNLALASITSDTVGFSRKRDIHKTATAISVARVRAIENLASADETALGQAQTAAYNWMYDSVTEHLQLFGPFVLVQGLFRGVAEVLAERAIDRLYENNNNLAPDVLKNIINAAFALDYKVLREHARQIAEPARFKSFSEKMKSVKEKLSARQSELKDDFRVGKDPKPEPR